MKLVVDQNIPFAESALAQFGEVILVAGRTLTAEQVRDADVLVVRSVTRVDEALLAGSKVRFVGTATIGTDHLDIPWLESQGIKWASAQGCNANSVVEWVLAALCEHALATGEDWRNKTIGIVGHGNIGSRLASRCSLIGLQVVVCDPPLAREGRLPSHVVLGDLLPEVDFLTIHVPLVREGQDRTIGLLGAKDLAALKKNAVLLNASRGDVIATHDLLAARKDLSLVLDVFEGEPEPSQELVQRCELVSPHVAGYSFEGKVNGTRMMASAIAGFLGVENTWQPTFMPPSQPNIVLTEADPLAAIAQAVRHSYDIRRDDANLRAGLKLASGAYGEHFDSLRKNYPVRREFRRYHIPGEVPPSIRGTLLALGFQVA